MDKLPYSAYIASVLFCNGLRFWGVHESAHIGPAPPRYVDHQQTWRWGTISRSGQEVEENQKEEEEEEGRRCGATPGGNKDRGTHSPSLSSYHTVAGRETGVPIGQIFSSSSPCLQAGGGEVWQPWLTRPPPSRIILEFTSSTTFGFLKGGLTGGGGGIMARFLSALEFTWLWPLARPNMTVIFVLYFWITRFGALQELLLTRRLAAHWHSPTPGPPRVPRHQLKRPEAGLRGNTAVNHTYIAQLGWVSICLRDFASKWEKWLCELMIVFSSLSQLKLSCIIIF